MITSFISQFLHAVKLMILIHDVYVHTAHTTHKKETLDLLWKKNCYCVKARFGSQLASLQLYFITASLII